jgi:hypothetical protein
MKTLKLILSIPLLIIGAIAEARLMWEMEKERQ